MLYYHCNHESIITIIIIIILIKMIVKFIKSPIIVAAVTVEIAN